MPLNLSHDTHSEQSSERVVWVEPLRNCGIRYSGRAVVLDDDPERTHVEVRCLDGVYEGMYLAVPRDGTLIYV